MGRMVISTSSSGLDNLKIHNNIQLIRLRMIVNNVEFIDGENISNESLQYVMSEIGCSGVKTSPTPIDEIVQLFTKLYHDGYRELFITTLSSKMSKSHEIIQSVADEFADRMNIYVYDCKELNVCEGMLALEAEYLMKQGKSLPEIAQRLDQLRSHHKMLFAVDDLSYLIKNKKLSATAGFFANVLNIKPVLQVRDDGAIVAVSKIRKFERALNYMVDDFAESIKNKNSFPYVLTAGRTEVDEYFVQLLKRRLHIDHITILPVSSISLANHGPTGVGLCVFDGVVPHAAKYYQ
ncbi:DegV family protein [Psychrobacter sp. I-STPA6b]|uniref:DegV family protein n=1 Tax=Psychrobacter sp. I-STPA6b TaxID=2585718 RepID=UPI001D0C7B46|nr:DegV family protein [Psychrobacter sp. I-STPA6b]